MCDSRVSLCVTVKQRNNWHRHDYTEPDDGSKPIQAGTPMFIKELQTRTFARYPTVTTVLTPWGPFCLGKKKRLFEFRLKLLQLRRSFQMMMNLVNVLINLMVSHSQIVRVQFLLIVA